MAGRRWRATLAGARRRRDEPPRAHSFLDVSCVYDATTNTLFVPAGLAVTGLVEPDLPPARRLAGTGMLMAHEMYRAFAGEGAAFDADGRERTWWNTDDWGAYNERAERVVAWFDDTYRPLGDQAIEGLGRRVLKETLADFGAMGVALSLAAQSDLDPSDLFVCHAQYRLRLMDADALDHLLQSGGAAPDATAVNLTLAQFDEFQTAFGVTEGDAMYVAPEERLLIW
jgi:putative endopeptidase